MDFQKAIVLASLLAGGLPLTACDSSANANESASNAVTAPVATDRAAALNATFDYQLRTEEYSTQDDRFPFGYWEIIRVYPELLSEDQPQVADAANERISELVNAFGCEGMGNESFHTREIYLGNGMLSLTYDAVWTCASMQAPDGTSRFLNLDLADGAELELDTQFRDRYTYERFQKSAIEALNDALEEQADDLGIACPEIEALSGFYTDGQVLWVAAVPAQYEQSECDVRVNFSLSSLQDQLKPDSPLRSTGPH